MATLCDCLNESFKDVRPAKLVLYSVSATLAVLAVVQLAKPGRLLRRTGKFLLSTARAAVQPIVDKQVNEAAKGLRFPNAPGERFFHSIPAEGLPDDEVVELSAALCATLDKKMDQTLLSGVVYWGTHTRHQTLLRILDQHLWSNPLFADYFGATRKMEAEIGSMCLALFNAPDLKTAAASYTMGGTESILVAMLAYTREGRSRGIDTPEIIVCESAHPAFDKAEQYFGCRLVKIPFDPKTFVMDVAEVEKSITSNTVAVVGSAPNYPFGNVDDLEGLSALAVRHGIGMHVDACVGGFLFQFYKLAGLQEIVVDFRLPGVTSISADIHKWGGAPKGASIALFRSKELRAHHIFAYPNFPGGLYVTSAVSGSKPGYTIACAWATLLMTGKAQYAANARAVVLAAQVFADRIARIPHLRILGSPSASIVAFTSDTIDIYKLMKKMCDKGYNLNALQFPSAVHLGLTMEHTMPGVMDAMLVALTAVAADLVEEVKGTTRVQRHDAMLYGSTQSVPDRGIIVEVLKKYVEAYYTNEKNDEPVAATR